MKVQKQMIKADERQAYIEEHETRSKETSRRYSAKRRQEAEQSNLSSVCAQALACECVP